MGGWGESIMLAVVREFRRIGVDIGSANTFAGWLSASDFVRWLRTVPPGLEEAALFERLGASPDHGGPHAPGPDESEAPDVATHVDAEFDGLIALAAQLERLLPDELLDGSLNYLEAGDPAKTAAILQTLPDGAGVDAVESALRAAHLDI